MPEIGGLVAIQAIRREHPDLPILAISGYYDKLQDVLHEAKVDAILPKPIRLGNLEHTLSTVLSEKSRSNGKSLETLQSRGASRHVRESSRQ
jgi:CheY-like chemotaxis protein